MTGEAPAVLMRAPKDPRRVVSLDASYRYDVNGIYGSNSGNLLFAESVYRALIGCGWQVVTDGYTLERYAMEEDQIAEIDRRFSALVLPLANAFRETFRPALRRLTSVIQRLKIPVVVAGVGAQLPLSGDTGELSAGLKEDVKQFVRVVLDRSASIGVRGESTARMLAGLGYGSSVIDVIGCPSLHEVGTTPCAVGRKSSSVSSTDQLAINLNSVAPLSALWSRSIWAQYSGALYCAQTHSELKWLLGHSPVERNRDATATESADIWFRSGRGRFFVDAQSWRSFLSGSIFSVGPRIHGNIAALTAGVPAMVLTFDSRTAELAEFHGIPRHDLHTTAGEVPCLDWLFERADMDVFNRLREKNTNIWLKFLRRNNLSVSGIDAGLCRKFDEELANANLAPVAAGAVAGETQLLQQATPPAEEVEQALGAYVPEWDAGLTHRDSQS